MLGIGGVENRCFYCLYGMLDNRYHKTEDCDLSSCKQLELVMGLMLTVCLNSVWRVHVLQVQRGK